MVARMHCTALVVHGCSRPEWKKWHFGKLAGLSLIIAFNPSNAFAFCWNSRFAYNPVCIRLHNWHLQANAQCIFQVCTRSKDIFDHDRLLNCHYCYACIIPVMRCKAETHAGNIINPHNSVNIETFSMLLYFQKPKVHFSASRNT